MWYPTHMSSKSPQGGWVNLCTIVQFMLLIGSVSSAQSPANVPLFSSEAQLVTLNAVVTDADSRHVTDLTYQDFAIYEGEHCEDDLGDPQVMSAPAGGTVCHDRQTGHDDGADRHVDSMQQSLPLVREATLELLRANVAEDRIQIVEVNNRSTILQPFTSDRAALETALDMLNSTQGTSTAVVNALFAAFEEFRELPAVEGQSRSAIILLTDGRDTDSLALEGDVRSLASRSETSVYVVNLATETDEFFERLTDDTGSRMVSVSSDNLRDEFARLAAELHQVYGLGYQTSDATRDGAWREIEVRLLAQDGSELDDLDIRHSEGYFALP